MNTYCINFNPVVEMTDDQFYQLCRHNPEVKFERNAKGEIIVMSPTGGETGNRNIEIGADFVFWNRKKKLGKLFDSSTCFKLPNGADPEGIWLRQCALRIYLGSNNNDGIDLPLKKKKNFLL